jgi:hypothetical protein
MFLRNYDNILTAFQFGYPGYTSTNTFQDGSLTLKTTGGSYYSIYISRDGYGTFNTGLFGYTYGTVNANYYYSYGLVIGSGNKNNLGEVGVDYNDFKLSNMLTSSDLLYVKSSYSDVMYDDELKTYTRTYSKTFQTVREITIREIGAIAYNSVLTYRELIPGDEGDGITIPAGVTFTVSIETVVAGNLNKPIEVIPSVEVEE